MEALPSATSALSFCLRASCNASILHSQLPLKPEIRLCDHSRLGRLKMVYDQTLTCLAQVLFRRFPLSISSSERRTDRRYSPAQSQLSLRIIAKDQLLNLAAELLPAESLRELIRHLDVISGIAEWDQIRFRRRRAILELAMRYFASSRLTTGMLVSPESLALHRFDLEQMERETGMCVAASSRTHPAPA